MDDVQRPGMLHCAFVRSPYARARIVNIDVTEAQALPGVHAGLRRRRSQRRCPSCRTPEQTSPYVLVDTPWAPLTFDEARFVGDPIALIIADDRYIAEDAMELVDVEYDALSPLVVLRRRRHRDGFVHDHLGTNTAGEFAVGIEETDAVFGSAKHVVEHTIHQQAYAAVPMETRGVVVDYSPSTDEMTIYASSQSPARGAGVRGPPARHARAPDPRDHEGHRRRLRAEDLHAAGGVGRRARCAQARRAAQVDRGPAGEPRSRAGSRESRAARSAWRSTPTGSSRPARSTSSPTPAHIRSRRRCRR